MASLLFCPYDKWPPYSLSLVHIYFFHTIFFKVQTTLRYRLSSHWLQLTTIKHLVMGWLKNIFSEGYLVNLNACISWNRLLGASLHKQDSWMYQITVQKIFCIIFVPDLNKHWPLKLKIKNIFAETVCIRQYYKTRKIDLYGSVCGLRIRIRVTQKDRIWPDPVSQHGFYLHFLDEIVDYVDTDVDPSDDEKRGWQALSGLLNHGHCHCRVRGRGHGSHHVCSPSPYYYPVSSLTL